MTESPDVAPLLEAVERYFKLMYDNDVSQFDRVFALTAQLHGFRDAELRILPAADYRRMLASTPSPNQGMPSVFRRYCCLTWRHRRRLW